jgi:hypothetical protein
MKIFALVNPSLFPAVLEDRFRSVLVVGTWIERHCASNPNLTHSELAPPMVVEWSEDRGDRAGIVWTFGGYDFLCSREVRRALEGLGGQFRFEDVVWNSTVAGESTYYWPVPRKVVSIDTALNGIESELVCSACGLTRHRFKLRPLTLPAEQVDERDVFSVREIGVFSPVFVTEKYANELTGLRLPNLRLLDAGLVR